MKLLERESKELAPKVLPAGWAVLPEFENCWRYWNGLRVMMTVELHDQDKWIHVSLSHARRLPSWSDLRLAKDLFIGKARTAIQVLPPEHQYVNYHPYALHLWCCLSKDILPDFRRNGLL